MFWGWKKEVKIVDCPGLVCPSLVGLELQVRPVLAECALLRHRRLQEVCHPTDLKAFRGYISPNRYHAKSVSHMLIASAADLANPFDARLHTLRCNLASP